MPPVLYKSNQTAFVIWCWDTLILFLLFAKKKKILLQHSAGTFFFYPPTRNLPLRPRSQSRGTTFRLNINIWHIFQTLLYPWHPRYKVQLFALLQSRGLSINPPPHPTPPQTTLPHLVTPPSVKTHSSPPSAMTQPAKALVSTTGQDNGV